ncbi:MAG: MBL fold metallo-hydrolase [bacterium]|nr:MBL fold metallo-hydrolase [bacterium]
MAGEEKTKKIIIRRIVVGPIETNCYLVADKETKEAVIIDPGDEPEKIFSTVKENGLMPKFILLTHKHPDHNGALKDIEKTLDIQCLTVGGGEKLKLGNLKITVIATPGHTLEGVCFIIEDNIFSGDTLFKQGIGRTDLASGDFNQIKKSLKRLMEFPDNFKVFPGHGPGTTIEEEKENNPFLTDLSQI